MPPAEPPRGRGAKADRRRGARRRVGAHTLGARRYCRLDALELEMADRAQATAASFGTLSRLLSELQGAVAVAVGGTAEGQATEMYG